MVCAAELNNVKIYVGALADPFPYNGAPKIGLDQSGNHSTSWESIGYPPLLIDSLDNAKVLIKKGNDDYFIGNITAVELSGDLQEPRMGYTAQGYAGHLKHEIISYNGFAPFNILVAQLVDEGGASDFFTFLDFSQLSTLPGKTDDAKTAIIRLDVNGKHLDAALQLACDKIGANYLIDPVKGSISFYQEGNNSLYRSFQFNDAIQLVPCDPDGKDKIIRNLKINIQDPDISRVKVVGKNASVKQITSIELMTPRYQPIGEDSNQTRFGLADTTTRVKKVKIFARMANAECTYSYITTIAGDINFRTDLDPATGNIAVQTEFNDMRAVRYLNNEFYFTDDGAFKNVHKVKPGNILEIVAGTGNSFFLNNVYNINGPATAANLANPWGLGVAENGDIYFIDQGVCLIMKVERATGIISIYAGNWPFNQNELISDGSPRREKFLGDPFGLYIHKGFLYCSCLGTSVSGQDGNGNPVFRTGPTEILRFDLVSDNFERVAGNGSFGLAPAGTPALSAPLADPWDLELDNADNLYIREDFRIIKFPAATNQLEVIAGTGTSGAPSYDTPANTSRIGFGFGIGVSPSGVVYDCDLSNRKISKIGLDGIIKHFAGQNNFLDAYGDGEEPKKAFLSNLGDLYIPRQGEQDIYIAQEAFIRFIPCDAGVAPCPILPNGGGAELIDFFEFTPVPGSVFGGVTGITVEASNTQMADGSAVMEIDLTNTGFWFHRVILRIIVLIDTQIFASDPPPQSNGGGNYDFYLRQDGETNPFFDQLVFSGSHTNIFEPNKSLRFETFQDVNISPYIGTKPKLRMVLKASNTLAGNGAFSAVTQTSARLEIIC